jgi:plasmid stability protein
VTAPALKERYRGAMPTIQIRDVPEDVYETIRRRARAAGQSIQAYMLRQVTVQARRRSKEEAIAAMQAAMAAEESPGTSVDSILRALDEVRS